MYKLYGDGIHDDHPAIQEMIDSGLCEVALPMPSCCYLISKPLVLPSNFRLVLPRFAHIRLMDGANCVMLRNRWAVIAEKASEPPSDSFWWFVDRLSCDPSDACENIEITGGIWDFNNVGQQPNPIATKDFPTDFNGFGMQFFNVKHFKLSNLTLKDPVNFAVTMDVVSYFTVENIVFDFNDGHPYPINMDGIHLDGNCHHGMLRKLQGNCYDDLVALNAHEGVAGPITNIVIDGLYADYCHSAVRLLRITEPLENIHISNVFGNYYNYCIGLTKFYPGEIEGAFDGITIENVYAAKAEPIRKGDFMQPPRRIHNYPIIRIQGNTKVKNLTLRNIHRREQTLCQELIHIGENCTVDRMIAENMTMKNFTGEPMPLMQNFGSIRHLSVKEMDSDGDECLVNDGSIGTLRLSGLHTVEGKELVNRGTIENILWK